MHHKVLAKFKQTKKPNLKDERKLGLEEIIVNLPKEVQVQTLLGLTRLSRSEGYYEGKVEYPVADGYPPGYFVR